MMREVDEKLSLKELGPHSKSSKIRQWGGGGGGGGGDNRTAALLHMLQLYKTFASTS